jgi:hypothetical protein
VDVAAALFIVAGFLVVARCCGLLGRASRTFTHSREALAVVRDRSLDDLAKEQAMQTHAKGLFGLFAAITAISAVSLGVPLGVVWLLDLAGLVDLAAACDALRTWPVLVAGVVLGWLIWRPARARPA